jgi:CheY-like chemotaxis protein
MVLKRLLLVEDDPRDTELTISALEEQKLANNIVVTRDGVEALEFLRCTGQFADRVPGNPVLILLDVKMPRMDGIELLHTIKTDDHLKAIPIVMLTSSRESKDLQECYRLGANAYVVKPVKFAQFIEAVKQIGVFWALVNEPPPGT